MNKRTFGYLPTGEVISLYTISNDDASLSVMERGGAIVKFEVYGKDIIGGYDNLDDYLEDSSHQGALIGRVANRVANAEFEMDGKIYKLPKNNNGNCLHGGVGFDYRVWSVDEFTEDHITLSYTSADGEEGFPSELHTVVTYKLDGTALLIDYKAYPKGKTPIALTNHSYFNLNGIGGLIEDHKIKIYADRYTAVNDMLIPNGEQPLVEGTVFDLKEPIRMGARLSEDFIGYDHNFILNGEKKETLFGKELSLAAEVFADELSMQVYTDQPGVQFYMGNFLGKGPDFRGGHKPVVHGAFCLETQTEPDCINHGVGFYEAGQVYTHSTVYKVNRN